MIFSVLMDGVSIYDETPEKTLLSPSVSTELNTAGSFDFTMPLNHHDYALPRLYKSTVEVYEKGEMIFFGRIIEINTDMLNRKQIHCEGGLAYFNDTIIQPQPASMNWNDKDIRQIFEDVIAIHNEQLGTDDSRKFTVGTVDIDYKSVCRQANYESTKDILTKFFLETTGGYFFTRRVNGVNYIDWLKDVPYRSNQPIQYGLNITELSKKINGGNIKTVIFPLGPEQQDGSRMTVQNVHSSDHVEWAEGVQQFGRIFEVVEFSDAESESDLLAKAQQWLADDLWEGMTVELDAAELSYLESTYATFRVGQMVQCTSNPHGLNATYPITKMSIDLDSAVKTVTVGTLEKQKLSEIYSDNNVSNSYRENGESGYYSKTGTPVESLTEESIGGSAGSGSSSYDDTALTARVTALESAVNNWTDSDTVYDDTQVRAAISQIQNELGNVRFSINSTDGGLDATIIEE